MRFIEFALRRPTTGQSHEGALQIIIWLPDILEADRPSSIGPIRMR
jgi:hypothetical protein